MTLFFRYAVNAECVVKRSEGESVGFWATMSDRRWASRARRMIWSGNYQQVMPLRSFAAIRSERHD